MKIRRLLTMLVALTLIVSVFAVTASAEEEMDYSPYLCFSWLDNWGDGWFESTDRDWYHDNRGMQMTPMEERWLKFYAAEWNGSDWDYTPIDPADLVVENLTVTPFADMPAEDVGDIIPGHDPKYFCRINANDWGNASISYTLDNGTVLTMDVAVKRNEDGFYNSMTLNNDTYIQNFRVNPVAEENVFYFGFQSTFWTLKDVQLQENSQEFATLEATDKRNVYKITIKPEVAEDIWSTGGFNVWLDVTVYNEDDTENYWEEVWCPNLRCEPLWPHDLGTDATLFINGEEFLIIGDAVMRNYFVGTDSDDDGNTWDVWAWEKTVLPDGVRYDVQSNTLTLNNAELTKLDLCWHWVGEGFGEESFNLPSQDLTIELIGENSIINDDDWAVMLRDEVNATITGDGSLYVKSTCQIKQNEWGDYYHYHAFNMHNSELTIAGDAKVTVEIAGEGWEGNDEWHQPAGLIALAAGWNDVTLRDNAVLTTVLPEDATSNGTVAPDPNEPWHRPGGYRGIADVNCLTIQDNATLNTTKLELHEHWEWDEENETDYIAGGTTLIMNGGTLNITAMPNVNTEENWQWNEETQENEFLGYIDVYHYCGINMWGQQSCIQLNGGVVNITAIPSQEHMEAGAYVEGFNVCRGEMIMNGGEVNIAIPESGDSRAFCVGDWGEEQFGKLTMNGGQINISSGYTRFEIAPYGEAEFLGGTVSIPSGNLNIAGIWEWNEELERDILIGGGSVLIDGTNITVGDGALDAAGDLTINSGSLIIKRAGDPERHPDDYILAGWNGGTITVNGGEFVVECTDINDGLANIGNFHQTGGSVSIIMNETEQWRANYQENSGTYPTTFAFQSDGSLTIDGGIFAGYGHYGITIYQNENDSNQFVVNGGEVVGNGEMNGIMLYQDATFNGGMVRAISRGRRRAVYIAGAEEPIEIYMGNAVVLIGDICLTIDGGDHRMEAYVNETYPKATAGIRLAEGARAVINDGSMRISSDMNMMANGWPEQGNPFTLSEDMVIYSMVDGSHPSFIEYGFYDYQYDEEGNVLFDDEGNPLYDESVTYYQYWVEEDGVYGGGDDEYANFSADIVVTSNKCGDDATWTLEDGVLTVNGTGAIYDYTDHLYTGIAPWMWLHDNNLIKTIVLDEEINAIGDYAFWHRDEIEAPCEVSIGMNVETVGTKAFASDANLTVICATGGEAYVIENNLDATVIHQYKNGNCSRCGDKMDAPFNDVSAGSFYFDPVVWAVENGVTTGASETTFNPNGECLRAAVVTFLWRAAGSPEPESTDNPFVDVASNAYYYKAVLWAVEKGITNGSDATHFNPFGVCNRAQVVTFLYRAKGSPSIENTDLPFEDVPATAWYSAPIAWAVENGITNGLTATQFGPNTACNRAQVVTFLYRAYVN